MAKVSQNLKSYHKNSTLHIHPLVAKHPSVSPNAGNTALKCDASAGACLIQEALNPNANFLEASFKFRGFDEVSPPSAPKAETTDWVQFSRSV